MATEHRAEPRGASGRLLLAVGVAICLAPDAALLLTAGLALSLGVAPFEGTGCEPDELLRAADQIVPGDRRLMIEPEAPVRPPSCRMPWVP